MTPAPTGTIWKVASVAVLGSFLAQIDATMLATALPVLAADMGADLAAIQWVVTGYLLAMVLMLPVAGVLVERIGARNLYLACYAGFGISAALCGLAWSAGSLIALRVLHGMVGGLMAPLAQMMIARVAGAGMGRIAGFAAIPILMGPVLGPVLAGFVLTWLDWRWLFAFTAGFATVGFALAWFFLPDEAGQSREAAKPVDWTGLVLLSPALVLLLSSLTRIATPEGAVGLAVAVVLLALFVQHLRRKGSAALIDPALLRLPVLRGAAMVQFLTVGVTMACQILLPVFLQTGLGRPVAEAGMLIAPLGLGLLIAWPLMGGLVERFGPRRVARSGTAAALLAIGLLIGIAGGVAGQILLPVALLLLGIGQGATGLAAMTAGYGAVPKAALASAATILNIAQRLGGPVLATLCGTLLGWLLQGMGEGEPHPEAFVITFGLVAAALAACMLAARELPDR
ncbi:MFS transporter [Xinfangfangia sp. D13-10-4-6]|uniref:MFS transporter n=1 Tax=Pseudogemmobacter hezensis TaxID=2737662 RepID=UPI001555DB69|nr:MFS transporter [Pseudogemmobacter hezensis]NPD17790.1 MFS transporter [Pseudogemmobacter hezensis]